MSLWTSEMAQCVKVLVVRLSDLSCPQNPEVEGENRLPFLVFL